VSDKECPKCGFPGPFYRNKSNPDGLDTYCKECRKIIGKKWALDHPGRVIELARKKDLKWRTSHPEEAKNKRHKKYLKHKERNQEYARFKYSLNKEKYKEYTKEWVKANPERTKNNHRKATEELRDQYIASLFRKHKSDLTPELIEAKREQLLLTRAIRALKQEIKNARKTKDRG